MPDDAELRPDATTIQGGPEDARQDLHGEALRGKPMRQVAVVAVKVTERSRLQDEELDRDFVREHLEDSADCWKAPCGGPSVVEPVAPVGPVGPVVPRIPRHLDRRRFGQGRFRYALADLEDSIVDRRLNIANSRSPSAGDDEHEQSGKQTESRPQARLPAH